jgi:hypothetical protein
MSDQPDYGRTVAIAFLAIVIPAVGVLVIYRTVLRDFPEITVGGWLLVCGYLLTVVVVPTVMTPILTRAVELERYTFGRAWRVTALLWVTITAIAGLLAWPVIGRYIKPFFVGAGRAL